MTIKLMTPRQVAKVLGRTEGALAQMRFMGTGPKYVKVNSKNVMYRRPDVDAWIESRTIDPAEAVEPGR